MRHEIDTNNAVLSIRIGISQTAMSPVTKLLEYIIRSINIALVSELQLVSGAMEVIFGEVIEAAKTKLDPGAPTIRKDGMAFDHTVQSLDWSWSSNRFSA